jgi:hypothetical protein
MTSSKQKDIDLILKLYELRRDAEMRQARAWYVTEFNPQSAEDIVRLTLSGQKESASYRMVTSYWDMAASFVNNGGIEEKLFLESNTEHMIVFARIEPFVAGVREMYGEPDYLRHLETLVMKVPDARHILENRRKLLTRWMRKETAE